MNWHSNLILVVLAAFLSWGTFNANGAATNSPTIRTWSGTSVPEGVIWKGSEIGCAIGLTLSEDAKVGASPRVDVYFKNEGTNDIVGVIQSRARFIVELNGKFYAMGDFGGKTSYMPPGRIYGPVSVDASDFWEISKLDTHYVNSPNHFHPGLINGKNTLRLHYKIIRDNTETLISSAELVIHK